MADNAGSVFLWGMGPPVPEPGAFKPRSFSWWSQYQSSLRIGPSGIQELSRTSRDLISLLPDPQHWEPRPTPFKGLVVGAVQSGKTSSMMGLAAVGMDQGYRIIIVLAGSKDDLRRQTARRFNTQLLRQSDRIFGASNATSLGRPPGKGPLGAFAPPYGLDTNQYALLQVRMEEALRRGEPCVVVVKKNVASLTALHGALAYCYRLFGVAALPTIVMDDECDDASVDAAGAPIPSGITNLWRCEGDPVRVAYVGYTATAAANILQHPDNDLYPAHFVYLLRYPGEEDTAIQFAVPNPDDWYTGGECFYEAFGDEPGDDGNFLVVPSVQQAELLGPVESNVSLRDALRAYFVSGAYRLALDPDRGFEPDKRTPYPHSMLVQTSQSTSDHLIWARGIQRLLAGRTLQDKAVQPSPDIVLQAMTTDEAKWRMWYDSIEASRERVYGERPHQGVQRLVTWDQVKDKLRSVIENTRLKVVNSDEAIGTSLDFAPRLTATGDVLPPQDVYVIVVGGARLSRGITLEGLCASYFTRWVPNPTEDTIQQLSRWFGYRGPYLEFCRLFCSRSVYESLRQMNENDIDLRYQLAELMTAGKPLKDAVLVLRASPRAMPTGKMGDASINELAFSPHATLLSFVECGPCAEANEAGAVRVVAQVRQRGAQEIRSASKVRKGLLSRGWGADEIADLLDSLRYTYHNPDNSAHPMPDYYRVPERDREMLPGIPLLHDPYQIAAYLRAWARREQANTSSPPTFNVGIAYGEMAVAREPFDFPLLNREIGKDNRIVGGLTGRSANWPGDAYFDGPAPQFRVQGSQQRLEGSEGLLLLYIVHKDAVGRAGRGRRREFHTPAFGISIPSGGPVFRRVVVAHR